MKSQLPVILYRLELGHGLVELNHEHYLSSGTSYTVTY